MTNNPFVNAIAAEAYIALIASVLFYGKNFLGPAPETILLPISMLSLFVLSAATMGYLFMYQPVRLLIEGKSAEAVKLFLSTVAVFVCFTLAAFVIAVLV